MDPRERADALLARARARGAFVVTPEDAKSPMDAANTQQIPRSQIEEIDHGEDGEITAVVPSSVIDSVDTREKPGTRVGFAPVDPNEEEVGGLIPTTTKQTNGPSELSRRLEGL